MDLNFNTALAIPYKSTSQKTRVMTESWVADNQYCPICGNPVLQHYTPNKPAADFLCETCQSDFELKSHHLRIGDIVPDGAYSTMIERISSFRNPNFLFMAYSRNAVTDLIFVPNHFFTPEVIIKRKPLTDTARRAGWTGCNINIGSIPATGRIPIIINSHPVPQHIVLGRYKTAKNLKTDNIEARGWLLDALQCVERITDSEFTLKQIYGFADELQAKHPNNHFIKAKLRQQLQILRDRGLIGFTARGRYIKTF